MKKFPKILALLLASIFTVTAFAACSDIGETLNTLGEVADLAVDVLEELDKAEDLGDAPDNSEALDDTDTSREPSNGTADEDGAETITEDNDEKEAEPTEDKDEDEAEPTEDESSPIDKNGSYTTKEDIALYIHTYGELPANFITKDEARALGWEGGGLDGYADGKCIGGDYFGNYEGLLPKAKGRKYTECDVDTLGKRSRGAKRIVFSNDGLIYYTDDHYESFELLYGNE